jgi:type IV secretion system protein VirB10
MPRYSFQAAKGLLTFVFLVTTLSAADPDRDFSGKWTLDTGSSRVQGLDIPAEPVLTIVQQETAIHCSTNASYALDGKETRYRVGGSTYSSAVKWEGNALLINTLVTGPRDYTVMDRWKLSRDHATLTITRQVMHGTLETEGVLVYRGEGWQTQAVPPPAEAPPVEAPPVEASPAAEAPRPILIRPEARARRADQADVTVPAGTRIPLALRNEVDTKHSREGDRIYLETIYPVAVGGRIVVPAGSFVNGTITVSKPAGKAKGKGELFIRFDSLTLPSGATREFRSRLGSAEGKTVDREEGKISGERDTGHDVGRVATTTGAGASIGGIAGAASGHAIQGIGIGAAIGAVVGLASIMGKRGPEATLHRGTTLEMILDRDISFTAAELRWY